jgi:tetraacyldisaccharide 4'-kinase
MKLNLDKSQELYFSFIKYDDFVFSEHDSITLEKIKRQPKLLVANCETRFFFRLYKSKEYLSVVSDHHDFTAADMQRLKNKLETI